jgi:hypothetical protein
MRIPQETKFYVSNASDLIPNIQYTKNVSFDEEGYIKLSPPFPRITATSEIPAFGYSQDIISIGSTSSQKYKVVTDDNTYDIDLDDVSTTLDAGAPTGNNAEARFVGWKGGDWYANVASDIYSLQTTAGTVWDIENTDAIEYAEVFVNRNALVGVSGGSTIQQYVEANMDGAAPTGTNSTPTLVIPSNFTIQGIAYSNYRLGIATFNKTGGSAYFFTWDGTTTEANQGVPVYANLIIDVVAYKNSWVVLTSVGELLYFNGGGFDNLGSLPCFHFDANWMSLNSSGSFFHGRTMQTDGDIIYFNLGSLLESTPDDSGILKGFYSGAWCYDPKIGIYHRYGISNSKLYEASISATSGTFTSVAHTLLTGDVVLDSNAEAYYAIYLTADTFKLADTYALAQAGTASADFATASYTLAWIKREDWSQLTTNNNNFGVCKRFENGAGLFNDGVLPFFIGGQVATKTMTADDILTVMAPSFENLGCVTYYKRKSRNIADTWQSIVVKHRPLTEGDKIIVKYKIRDSYKQIAIGEAGDISADANTASYITWTNSTTFTTTKDLTDVNVGDEVEFMSGAGAGQTAHVVTATNNAGTWTVVVDEVVRGGASGNKSTCIFDSFIKLATITATTQDPDHTYIEHLGKKSKWIQVKLELRGIDVTIEDMDIINTTDKPSK